MTRAFFIALALTVSACSVEVVIDEGTSGADATSLDVDAALFPDAALPADAGAAPDAGAAMDAAMISCDGPCGPDAL